MKTIFTTVAILVATWSLQAQVNQTDKDFMKHAAEGGIMEVKLGQLAASNGSSQEVKELGRMMEEQHTKANGELKALAAKKNVSLPADMTEKDQKTYKKLSALQGKDFDKEYSDCMVKDHKEDISKFKAEADKGGDADLKSWAAKTVPTLEHHLEMSKNTCKAVKNEK